QAGLRDFPDRPAQDLATLQRAHQADLQALRAPGDKGGPNRALDRTSLLPADAAPGGASRSARKSAGFSAAFLPERAARQHQANWPIAFDLTSLDPQTLLSFASET